MSVLGLFSVYITLFWLFDLIYCAYILCIVQRNQLTPWHSRFTKYVRQITLIVAFTLFGNTSVLFTLTHGFEEKCFPAFFSFVCNLCCLLFDVTSNIHKIIARTRSLTFWVWKFLFSRNLRSSLGSWTLGAVFLVPLCDWTEVLVQQFQVVWLLVALCTVRLVGSNFEIS